MRKFFVSVLFLFLTLACTEANQEEVMPSRDLIEELQAYFPVETGFYRDYRTTATTYFTASSIETDQFLVREQTGPAEANLAGGITRELRRYQRQHEAEEWVLDSLWAVRVEQNPMPRIVQIENGQPFIKLVTPLTTGTTWDGNGLNGKSAESYTYLNKMDQYEVDGEVFEDAIEVLQLKDDDRITVREIRYEVYAKNRGMVHRYVAKLRYCSRPECLGQEIIEQGIIIEMTQVAYGFN
jgi:hypothetical protein